MLYILAKLCEYISKVSLSYRHKQKGRRWVVGIYKGHNSIITVDGVIVVNLYTLSDDALYLYQVSIKYLTGFHSC